jgi:predicted nuclease with TOPRIM domain
MVSLEQVKLLESKVTNTIEYVKKVTGENAKLKEKLDSYQKRIEELEVLVHQFKENQSRIEDGILSALDRLNQFEDALESKLSVESKPSAESLPSAESKPSIGNTPDAAKRELDIF